MELWSFPRVTDGKEMSTKHIMFLGLILAAGTLISLTFGGAWFDSTDLETLNSMTVFKQAEIFGIWSITVPNISFFITGAKALMQFDFAFFPGSLAILQWFFFFVIGIATMWGFYTVIIGVVQGVFGRR